MITFLKKEYKDEEIFAILDQHVRQWFKNKFKTFTPPQRFSIVEIHKGENVLICSPTGSGKTLSAFLAIINELIELGRKGELEDKVYALYISPLKALNNDVKRNLEEPLQELQSLFAQRNITFPNIRVSVRTGDTSANERSKMLKKPPHILITTPESLALLLSARKASKMLEAVRWVVVDELHALAENKRGTSLSLSLERLSHRIKVNTGYEPVRIGLSATVNPLETMAQFLVGEGRPCKIVDVSFEKPLEIVIHNPTKDIIRDSAEEVFAAVKNVLLETVRKHRTTLIFTNTRSATERISHMLKKELAKEFKNKEVVFAHHSSLSKEVRFEVEEKLKRGEVKVVVSSTSLELGIDIGNIDVVVLLGSPKSVARTLQRIGRSGHRLHEISRGILIPLHRDELIEESMILKCAKEREIDRIRIVENALDVLAQHLVGMALEKEWNVDEAYGVIKKSYCYRNLKKEDMIEVLKYLSGFHALLEKRNVYGKVWFDGKTFSKRRGSSYIYFLNSGTIPEETYVPVYEIVGGFPKRMIGKVEEEFAEKLTTGDVFVLGGRTYEYVGSFGIKLGVVEVRGVNPNVPAWYSERLPLSYDLAVKIQEFRLGKWTPQSIAHYFYISERDAKIIYDYLREQEGIHGKHIVIEQHYDREREVFEHVFQFSAGRKANEAMARVVAYRIGKRLGINVAMKVGDYGFALITKEKISKDVIMSSLSTKNFIKDLKASIKHTDLLRRRFRHVAVRSFLILKQYKDKNVSADRQQLHANALLQLIEEHLPNFPVLKEAEREVLEDAMHADEALDYLKKYKKQMIFKEVEVLSPFSFDVVSEGGSDTLMMEDKRSFIKKLHEQFMSFVEQRA